MTAPLNFEEFLPSVPRHLFFTGKGGVGKTSLASATALALSKRGARVLLVSTDPASNLDEVLGEEIGSLPTKIAGAPNLSALNIDPEKAAAAYRERIVAPFRGKLPDAAVANMEEQLSGACTVEIAGFQEFTGLLANSKRTEEFDQIVFDTAPTGHTLRLLALPKAWENFLDANKTGASCLGPLSGLQSQRAEFELAFRTLSDKTKTVVILVSRPQEAALREAERTSKELKSIGIANQVLFLNGRFKASDKKDAVAAAWEARAERALSKFNSFIFSMPILEFPLQARNLVSLRSLENITAKERVLELSDCSSFKMTEISMLGIVESLQETKAGLIMLMGKGGVGKTTIAAAIATHLASNGFPVHLTTTDPAAHIVETVGSIPNLQISRINPHEETQKYITEVMESSGKHLDDEGRALLAEELRSPCTEEIAVFRAFAKVVGEAEDKFVVIDTAPTGHTLLLLDATESYHREVTKRASTAPPELLKLLPRLRDPGFSKIILITLPEPTPVHEAQRFQTDLRRAGIEPFAWVVNQCLLPLVTTDPLLASRRNEETRYVAEVEKLAKQMAIVPLMNEEPVGVQALGELITDCTATAST